MLFKPKKKVRRRAVLYARVKEENKEFMIEQARESGLEMAIWLDQYFDNIRRRHKAALLARKGVQRKKMRELELLPTVTIDCTVEKPERKEDESIVPQEFLENDCNEKSL